jgi:hypothetical protein
VEADGPALRVRATGRPETRYPLYRVSRVIASTCVNWSAAALESCLQSGIPIVIVRTNGEPVGSVHPVSLRPSPASEALKELLDRTDWREIYGNWLRARRMKVLASWRREMVASGKAFAPGEFAELVRTWVYGRGDTTALGAETGIWRGALRALAASGLRRWGLDPVYWGAGGIPLDLLGDVTRILELRLRLEVRPEMQSSLGGEEIALKVFHSVSAVLEHETDRVLLSLARRVKQVLSEWV